MADVKTTIKPLADYDIKALCEGAEQREALAAVMLRDNKLHGRTEILEDAADAWERAGKTDDAIRVLGLIEPAKAKGGRKDK